MKVILRLAAKPDKVEELKAILTSLVAPTRKEAGCLSYEIFQNRADPCDFTFVEEWASDAALDAHWATAHVQDALARGVPLLAAEPDDRRYRKIA
jgi:quinol monooxygenase YgiN